MGLGSLRGVYVGLAIFVCCGVLRAQQAGAPPASQQSSTASARLNSLELEQENSDRVGASPQRIREILVKDPGLLVELKRWVSREATSNEQVIDDADLTDQAIFDRLEEDVAFRAAATRLVQRYGYLVPSVNPDSELGKQQAFIMKERVRRLVQIEAQEDAERSNRHAEEDSAQPLQRAATCESRREGSCGDNGSSPSRQNNGKSNGPAQTSSGSQGGVVPSEPLTGSPVLRAGIDAGSATSATLGLNSSSDSMRLATLAASPNSVSSRVSLADAESGADGFGSVVATAGSDFSRTSGEQTTTFERRRSGASSENDGRDSVSIHSGMGSSQPAILHVRGPYADIPSLYDLYVQVPIHQGALERFGVDIFSSGLRDSKAIPMDLPVGPDYIVGPGDSLAIDMWGGVSQRMLRVVDRQGRIALPEAGPLLVSGSTLGAVQVAVQQALRSQYRDTSADVSLLRLRTVRVYVVGEVADPGAYDISSLSTPLNALVAAGGVTPRGSLRSLKHYRGKQLIEVVDAYDLLLRGVGTDQKRLETGDSLLVPPAGPEITIEGMVRRPAIYELHGENTLEEALELAGGVLPAAALQHVEVERLVAHQKRTMFSLDLSSSDVTKNTVAKLSDFEVQDGDRVHIFPIAPYNDEAIYLQGHVLRPGRYSYREGMKLSDLVSSYTDLLPEPAGKYAEIIRLNPPDFRPTVESFDLSAALANPMMSPNLKPLDTVRIFSKFAFEPPSDVSVSGEVREPGLYATSGQVWLRDALYLAGGVTSNASLDTAQLFRTSQNGSLKILSVNLSEALAGNPAENLRLEPHDRIIVHRNSAKVDPPTVYVKGEVAKPGRYPLGSNMSVEDLVRVSGGLKRSADSQYAILSHLEVSSSASSADSVPIDLSAALAGDASANRPLSNGDVLTIRQTPGWNNLGASVTIRGEVLHSGVFGIRPGDSLATVLGKAGGFTSEAYPYGTVLARREVRDLELKSREELVARVRAEEAQLKVLPENDADQKNAKLTAIAQAETTLAQLQANLPIGRVVIQSSPDMKMFEKSAASTPLRNGDVIVVPKRANYVLVNGQVFNATAVGYASDRSARWYLSQAGGLTPLADKNAVFVIRANGSVLAAKNNSSLWSGDPMSAVLLPGDSIIVPEKAPKVGTRNWAPLIQSAQLATSVALAVAYLKP